MVQLRAVERAGCRAERGHWLLPRDPRRATLTHWFLPSVRWTPRDRDAPLHRPPPPCAARCFGLPRKGQETRSVWKALPIVGGPCHFSAPAEDCQVAGRQGCSTLTPAAVEQLLWGGWGWLWPRLGLAESVFPGFFGNRHQKTWPRPLGGVGERC